MVVYRSAGHVKRTAARLLTGYCSLATVALAPPQFRSKLRKHATVPKAQQYACFRRHTAPVQQEESGFDLDGRAVKAGFRRSRSHRAKRAWRFPLQICFLCGWLNGRGAAEIMLCMLIVVFGFDPITG